jgi:hypothetical protein
VPVWSFNADVDFDIDPLRNPAGVWRQELTLIPSMGPCTGIFREINPSIPWMLVGNRLVSVSVYALFTVYSALFPRLRCMYYNTQDNLLGHSENASCLPVALGICSSASPPWSTTVLSFVFPVLRCATACDSTLAATASPHKQWSISPLEEDAELKNLVKVRTD